ncbi:hypothetical protein [Conchiformibius steedae]|uniref:hypothetical protein n=1 Tax=Conchiformibius steedae TaxID=153493 RepID=UPI0026EF9C1F|nr:hypothetical protein [Conchiformibius steedae]
MKHTDKIIVGAAALLLAGGAWAADGSATSTSGLSEYARRFFEWFASFGGGASKNHTLANMLVAIERQTILGFGIVSRFVLIGGILLSGSSIIKYIRHAKGQEQVSAAHSQFFVGLGLIAALPLLQAFGKSFGFSSDIAMFESLSNLAKSCAGVMGQMCSTSDPDELKNAFILTMFRLIKLFGFMAFCWGWYSIIKIGQANGNRMTKSGAATFIFSGICLYYFVDVLMAIGNSYFYDTPFTEMMRNIYTGKL